MRYIGITLSVLLMLCLLAGCGAQIQPVATPASTPASTTALTAPPQAVSTLFGVPLHHTGGVLNPLTDGTGLNRGYYNLTFDTLFTLDEQLSPVFNLCIGVRSEPLRLTLTIRTDGVFHDDTALSAADVVYSLEMAKASPIYGQRLEGVIRITTHGADRVELVLEKEQPDLLRLLDIPVIKKGTGVESDAVGSGRYCSVSTGGQQYLLPATTHYSYRGQTLALTHMLITQVADTDALIYGVAAGNIGILRYDPLNPNGITLHANADRYAVETSTLYYLGCALHHPLLNNTEVRSALLGLLDIQALCDATEGALAATKSLYHPVLGYEGIRNTDSLEARQEAFHQAVEAQGIYVMSGAGYYRNRAGLRLELTVAINGTSVYERRLAEQLTLQLKAVGVYLQTQVVAPDKDWKDYGADLLLASYAVGNSFDFSPLLTSGGTANRLNWSDNTLTVLLKTYQRQGVQAGAETAWEIDRTLAQHAVLLPLGYKREQVLINRKFNLSGVKISQTDLFWNVFDWVSAG